MGKGKLSEKELDEVHNAIFVFIFLINLLIGQGCPVVSFPDPLAFESGSVLRTP